MLQKETLHGALIDSQWSDRRRNDTLTNNAPAWVLAVTGTCKMSDDIDDLIVLLSRSDGKRAAITTYEEETGVKRDEAVQEVERLSRKHGIAQARWKAWRTGMIIAAAVTVSILCLLFAVPF
jgi:hypothetical protein